jgi:hypothetical protein
MWPVEAARRPDGGRLSAYGAMHNPCQRQERAKTRFPRDFNNLGPNFEALDDYFMSSGSRPGTNAGRAARPRNPDPRVAL